MSFLRGSLIRFSQFVARQTSKQVRKDLAIRELLLRNVTSDDYIVNRSGRLKKVVVSLTSFGSRVDDVFLTIESIGLQSMLADEVVLWLAEDEYSDATLPQSLKNLRKRGLQVRFCKDIRQYKKLIPSLKEYPNDIIITIDDDIIYNQNLVLGLYNAHLKSPRSVCCYRGHLMRLDGNRVATYRTWEKAVDADAPSHLIMATGVGGVLYFPGCFHSDIEKEELFMELCPTNDDIWFKFMALLNGTACAVARRVSRYDEDIVLDQAKIGDLGRINVGRNANDVQIQRVVDYYKLEVQDIFRSAVDAS